MASNIDNTVPVAGAMASAAPLRENFAAAKSEIEALQSAIAGRLLPDPASLPNGAMVQVVNGAWVLL